MESDFNRTTQAFLNWFRSLPGATFHKGIETQDLRFRGAGRGIIATTDIEAETVLFTIPRNSIICASTSDLCHKLPELFDPDNWSDEVYDDPRDDSPIGKQLDSWSSLILILVYETLRSSESAWKPYLDVLPGDYSYTPMFWPEEDLQELQASPMVARIGKEAAAAMIRSKIIPVVHAHADIFYAGIDRDISDEELTALALRMGSTIMAYAFELEEDESSQVGENENDEWEEDREGKTMMGMVPMADILNADAEFNAHVNHGDEALVVTALRPIAKGEEILNYYGPLPNSELLRRYGYVSAKHDRYNVVDLPWDLVASATRQELALEAAAWEMVVQQLDSNDLEDGFIIERDTDGPDSTGVLLNEQSVADIPEDLVEQTKQLLKAARKVVPEMVENKAARDAIMYRAMMRAADAREARYLTTLEQDQELLEKSPAEGAQDGRYMAIKVRRGEKVLLRETKVSLQARLDRITMDVSNMGGPAAKRRKTKQ